MAIEENPFDHILYEFEMYLHASLIRCNDQFVTNLLIDSRMVHLRNIAYFFCTEQDRDKKYMHYSTYINGSIPKEVDHELYHEVQRITSNATCHMQKGRLDKDTKEETQKFEQTYFGLFVSLIKNYLFRLNESVSTNYLAAWNDKQIQLRSNEIMKTIHKYKTAISLNEPVCFF